MVELLFCTFDEGFIEGYKRVAAGRGSGVQRVGEIHAKAMSCESLLNPFALLKFDRSKFHHVFEKLANKHRFQAITASQHPFRFKNDGRQQKEAVLLKKPVGDLPLLDIVPDEQANENIRVSDYSLHPTSVWPPHRLLPGSFHP